MCRGKRLPWNSFPISILQCVEKSTRPGKTHYCLPVVQSESISVVFAQPWPLPIYPVGPPLVTVSPLLPQELHTECDKAPKQMKNLHLFLSASSSPERQAVIHFSANRPGQGEQAEGIWEISCEDSDMLSLDKDGPHFASACIKRLHQFPRKCLTSAYLWGQNLKYLHMVSFCTIWIAHIKAIFSLWGQKLGDMRFVRQKNMCPSALFVQLSTDLNQHIYTHPSCMCLSCLLRCTYIHRQSSPFAFLTSHGQLTHAQACVTRYKWMCRCYCFFLTAIRCFNFSGRSQGTSSRWWMTHKHLHFPRCSTLSFTVHGLNECPSWQEEAEKYRMYTYPNLENVNT